MHKTKSFQQGVQKYFTDIYLQKTKIYDGFSRCQDKTGAILKGISSKVDFKNKRVLDVGAGTGKFSLPISKKASLLYALEPATPMLGILKKKIRQRRVKNIKVLKGNFEKIPLPANSVDVIISAWCFPIHSNSREKDLKELRRVLRKHGKIILVDNYHKGGEYCEIKKRTSSPSTLYKSYKFSEKMRKWMKSKKFEEKVITTTADFGSKRNIERLLVPVYGPEMAVYLLARNKTSYKLKVSIFYG